LVGIKVNSSGINIVDRKIAVINDWPVLASTAQIRPFLRLADYYRTFGHKFAHRTTQLYALTAEKHPFQWLRVHLAEFDNIGKALASAQLLAQCDPKCDYILHTDTSDLALEVLWLKCNPGEWWAIRYNFCWAFSLENYIPSRHVTQHMIASCWGSTTI
jgi:hypothetical protein